MAYKTHLKWQNLFLTLDTVTFVFFPLGVGIYKTPSFLNHSCQPNCVAVFNGTRLLIHATENTRQGDELTISYTELLCPSYQRKEDLKSRYLFECKCAKCSSSLEEDGLMLSLQCSDASCNGAVPRDLESEDLKGHLCDHLNN